MENQQYESGVASVEELVSEIATSAVLQRFGIKTYSFYNNSDCEKWINLIKDNPSILVKASSSASKAVNFFLGLN